MIGLNSVYNCIAYGFGVQFSVLKMTNFVKILAFERIKSIHMIQMGKIVSVWEQSAVELPFSMDCVRDLRFDCMKTDCPQTDCPLSFL